MSSLLRYLSNVHEVRAMEPLTLLQGLKQLDFRSKSTKHLWIAYKKRLKEVAPTIDFNQLSMLILNIPLFVDRNFVLLESLMGNLINKSFTGQFDSHKSLINLLKHLRSIGYTNSSFVEYVTVYFDQLALSKLNIHMLADLCNSMENCTQEFTSKLSNTFHFLLKSIDLDISAYSSIESAAKCLIGLSKLSNGLDRELSNIGKQLLSRLQPFSEPLTPLLLLNSIIRDETFDVELYDQYINDALAKINYENVSKEIVSNLLQLSSKIRTLPNIFFINDVITNSLNSNLIIYNGVDTIELLHLCIKMENCEIAIRIIDNMKIGKLSYNECLALLDCFYHLKNKFNIDIVKAGYVMDQINYQLCYKPEVPLLKKLKLGYVEQQTISPISGEVITQFCYIASIAAEFDESFDAAQHMVISIVNSIKSQYLWSKLTPIDIHNLLSSISKLKIRQVDTLDTIATLLDGINIDHALNVKITKSFAELGYPWVEYSNVFSRGRKYLIAKFASSNNSHLFIHNTSSKGASIIRNDDCLKANFLYGFATRSNVIPFRISKLVNRNLWNVPFNWHHLFNGSNCDTHKVALDKLENMISDNGYKVFKRNVKWKGLFNVDILAIKCNISKPGKPSKSFTKNFVAINLLMPGDFYTDGSVVSRKRLQLHLLALDIDTLNVHYEEVLRYRQNIATQSNEVERPN